MNKNEIEPAAQPQRSEQFKQGFSEGWLRACVFYVDIDACDPEHDCSKQLQTRLNDLQQPPATDDRCVITGGSSEMCNLGTKSCEIHHATDDRVKEQGSYTVGQGWKVWYPSEGCEESDLVFTIDGVTTNARIKTSKAKLICDAHNAALAAENNRVTHVLTLKMDEYRKELASEREKADNLFKVARKHCVDNKRLKEQWELTNKDCEAIRKRELQAQAAIADITDACSYSDARLAVKSVLRKCESVDLSALDKHDKELVAYYRAQWGTQEHMKQHDAEVRKPLVDALQRASDTYYRNFREDGRWITCHIAEEAQAIDDALGNVKGQP